MSTCFPVCSRKRTSDLAQMSTRHIASSISPWRGRRGEFLKYNCLDFPASVSTSTYTYAGMGSTNYSTSTEYVFNGDTLLSTVDQKIVNGKYIVM